MVDNESVDRIVSQIIEDGEKEIASITDKAERTASEITEKAEKNGEAIAEKILKESQEKGEAIHRRTLSSVNIEVKRTRLKAREEIVSAINLKVLGALENIRSGGDYPDLMADMIVEAVMGLEGSSFQVYADRGDIDLLKNEVFDIVREKALGKGIKIELLEAMVLEKSSIGGARVGVPGGRVIFDNTFEARIYRMRDDIRNIIFEEVFEPEGSEGSNSA
ncbi:MAG: V-type ATP synthase subunit E [Candidatus Krumholzibacteriota bacterium]|nr:V-type ATP synthase subunit E [Candidatus Krumholzibacteriota bacterium]